MTPTYGVELRLDGTLIGDIRHLAQNLKWTRRMTQFGVDSITFTLNDAVFARWLQERGMTPDGVIRPLALDCRITRNGVPMVGGFLATMPGYSPRGTSADFEMQFDGYLNLLAGVFIPPTSKYEMRMGALIQRWISDADSKAATAGKAFGFSAGEIDTLATVIRTFNEYKSVASAIADASDNITGAGQFEVYFHEDKTYDVKADSNFGKTRLYVIHYPTMTSGVSALSIAADEISGFASHTIAVGNGETSDDEDENTAIVAEAENSEAVLKYGYRESVTNYSSITTQSVLQRHANADLATSSAILWQPKITLSGRQIAPSPEAGDYIWLGDTITIQNTEDYTGTTSGSFRVRELEVAISAQGGERITPTLERIEDD